MKPRVLILHATGTNRDHDAAQAFEMAGALPEIVHINQLRQGERRWSDYQMLVVPGGFSYADALGAGRLLALDLTVYFSEEVARFVAAGKPVIGICNGFQALVKSGILPGVQLEGEPHPATLTHNANGHFECRWVTLKPNSTRCLWTRELAEPIYCPIAHGEGNFVCSSEKVVKTLQGNEQLALTYVHPDGRAAAGAYPANPNGSILDVAGICNPEGNVLGLMPHPENHIYPHQHPHFSRGEHWGSGLALFVQGVTFAGQM